MTVEPRHAFFETDNHIEINIFVKDVVEDAASVQIEPKKLVFTYEDKHLVLEPLRGEVDVERSETRVGKVKVEIRLIKTIPGRWGGIVGDAPTLLASTNLSSTPPPPASKKATKNWDAVVTNVLASEKEKTTNEDPNVGGDAAVNSFFQQIYGDADEDTRRAMLKSYTESGGTALSTDWKEVSKGKVEIKPPSGSEARTWEK